jgi:ATP-binding cassette subfamily B protein
VESPEASLFWPLEGAPAAIDALLECSGIPTASAPPAPRAIRRWEDLAWLKRIPQIGVDVQSSVLPPSELLERLAVHRGPCLVCDPRSMTLLAVVFDTFDAARIIRPDWSEVATSRSRVLELVRSARPETALEGVFAGLRGGDRALRALVNVHFDAPDVLFVGLTLDAAHPLVRQLSSAGAFRALAMHVVLVAVQSLVSAGALWTLGTAILDGHVDAGRVIAWTVMSLGIAPLQYLAARALGRFSLVLAERIKRRMLEGTFRIQEQEIRRQGLGLLLARANEASLVERIDLLSVFDALSAAGQLGLAAYFFAQSGLVLPLTALLGVAVVLLAALGHTLFRSHALTYGMRLQQTSDLVDKILGHRTRAVQQPAARYHLDEDRVLSAYVEAGRRHDALRTLATTFPRLWLSVAALVLLGAFVAREPVASLAWAALGVVVAQGAMATLGQAMQNAATWWTAFRGVRPLLDAGATRDRPPRRAREVTEQQNLPVVLAASSLSFAYRPGRSLVLEDASLRVRRGERVLVTGPSGGGKTTLFKLIAGELRPSGGVILVDGSDPHVVSEEEWRERVASAPQFHENYVFTQPLAFNLDPRGELASASPEAQEICAELGLDRVIARMPQGYAQLLGETGWQLSHGERSRLFIARALLQGADLFLFDESFGALDPETQARAIECVRKRAKTLMVVAHA